jgi:hypothetical protein
MTPKPKALMLDDVREVSKVVPEGHDVHVARSAREALHVVATSPRFDVWYLDFDLDLVLAPSQPGQLLMQAVSQVGAPTGLDFLKMAKARHADKWPRAVHVHSQNPDGRAAMLAFLQAVEV